MFNDDIKDNYNSNDDDDGNINMHLIFNTVHLLGPGRNSFRSCPNPAVVPLCPRGCGRWAQSERTRTGSIAPGTGERGAVRSSVLPWCPLLRPLLASQVLQGGGLESPTKPKGRPKKNSIPSSEQLSEQERTRDAEKPPESLGSPAEVSQEE